MPIYMRSAQKTSQYLSHSVTHFIYLCDDKSPVEYSKHDWSTKANGWAFAVNVNIMNHAISQDYLFDLAGLEKK